MSQRRVFSFILTPLKGITGDDVTWSHQPRYTESTSSSNLFKSHPQLYDKRLTGRWIAHWTVTAILDYQNEFISYVKIGIKIHFVWHNIGGGSSNSQTWMHVKTFLLFKINRRKICCSRQSSKWNLHKKTSLNNHLLHIWVKKKREEKKQQP